MLCARLCVRGGLLNGEGDPLAIFDDEELEGRLKCKRPMVDVSGNIFPYAREPSLDDSWHWQRNVATDGNHVH